MASSNKNSPLIERYEKDLISNPNSRAFAPLAEIYRKLGMMDEAYEVLKKGIQRNPGYLLGYIVLATCYKNQDKIEPAYNVLKNHIESNRDNFLLQKLYASLCMDLKYFDEALENYKFALFLNPKDKEIASIVLKLEDELLRNKVTEKVPAKIEKNFSDDEISDQWVQVELSTAPASKPIEMESEVEEEWSVSTEPLPQPAVATLPGTPLPTLTLADLYVAQGYYVKAKEVLDILSKEHPSDPKISEKLIKIRRLIDNTEDEGHQDLMNIFDSKVTKQTNEYISFLDNIKEKFNQFAGALRLRASQERSGTYVSNNGFS